MCDAHFHVCSTCLAFPKGLLPLCVKVGVAQPLRYLWPTALAPMASTHTCAIQWADLVGPSSYGTPRRPRHLIQDMLKKWESWGGQPWNIEQYTWRILGT